MGAKKLLILSVSAGAGHVRAAEALRTAAAARYPGVEAIHMDLMEWVPRIFRTFYAESFLYLVEKHPELWGYLYGKTDRPKDGSKLDALRKGIDKVNTIRFMKMLKDIDPDHVICTHFLPAQLLARKLAKGAFKLPVWVQVTDFDVHRLWIHGGLSGYFAASEEVAWRMADRGIPRETVHVTGIPIMPAFSAPLDRAACARELGLDPSRPTLLLMAGGAGVGAGVAGGGMDATAARLLALDAASGSGKDGFQIVALAGRNEALLKDLKSLAAQHPGRLFPMGFTRTIERAMAAADLAVTKPGGLTSSECLAMGLPMILVNHIPGQEERNADYLLENGAALKAYDAAGLLFRVKQLMADPGRLRALGDRARALGRPHAAEAVLARVLGAPGATASKSLQSARVTA
jgi:processive 1,2-diacylglycerol beta-glucosyltransferase